MAATFSNRPLSLSIFDNFSREHQDYRGTTATSALTALAGNNIGLHGDVVTAARMEGRTVIADLASFSVGRFGQGNGTGEPVLATNARAATGAATSVAIASVDGDETVNRGVDPATATTTVTVVAANEAPDATAGLPTGMLEDQLHVFTTAEVVGSYSDPEGDAFTAIMITKLASDFNGLGGPRGTLFFDADGAGGAAAVAVTLNQIITRADLDAGKLSFLGAPNDSGNPYGLFEYAVQDSQGTFDPTPTQVQYSVAAVNDAPTFTAGAFAIERVSTDAAGAQATSNSLTPVFSPDGTKVAFSSFASNLVAGDTNNTNDIFVKDLVTGAVTRVSTGATGTQATGGGSTNPVFSPDGTKVAFSTGASNLVAGDTNGLQDIFVKDLVTGAITRVSTGATGAQATGTSSTPVFSPDGTKVAFSSFATNLVAGDTNLTQDIFVKDLVTGAITRVSTGATGAQATGSSGTPVFSPDGTKVAFTSTAANLVAGDTNGQQDIFVKDLVTGAITRVSTDAAGGQAALGGSAAPVFSPDGTKVAFSSGATNLVAGDTNNGPDIFVKDLVTGAITRVSTDAAGAQATGFSGFPVFSPDGTKVAFTSTAANLVAGDTNGLQDIFVKDLVTGAITRVSTDAAGTQATGGGSLTPVFSADGTMVAFGSNSNNLVAGDTNGAQDIFVATLGNAGVTYTENGAPVAVASTVNVTDIDSTNFDGGSLTVAIGAGGAAGDLLTIANARGIVVTGTSVAYNGVEIGILTASATGLLIAFDADATPAAVKALAEAVRFSSTSNDPTSATRTVSFTLVDGDGTADGGQDSASFSRDVSFVAVNDAPQGNDATITFDEDTSYTLVAADFGFSDLESNAFTGAVITTLPTNGVLLLNGVAVTVAGTFITAAQMGVGQFVFQADANENGAPYASFTFQVRDTGGTANGGVDTDQSPNTLIFNVTAVNNAPVITVADDSVEGREDSDLVFSAANGNAITVADADGGSLTVTLGVARGTLTLSQTAGLSFSVGDGTADTTITFSGSAAAINAALEGLAYRGAPDYNGVDSLVIAVDDGVLSDTATIAIALSDDNFFLGTSGNDVLVGTPEADYFDLSQGGSDTAFGLASNDGFYFGAALDTGDVVDGGAGDDDQIGLQGNYGFGSVLQAANFNGVETFALLGGDDTSFGDTRGNSYSYNLTTSGSFGRNITINANGLRAGENLYFDGSAEMTGSFTIYGGFGNDVLIGGAGNDGFYFGPDRLNDGDLIIGGGGTDNQLALRGDYRITFSYQNVYIENIQTIALLSDMGPGVAQVGDGAFEYSITIRNEMVAAGQQLTVTGAGLGVDERMEVDGSAVTDGTLRLIGGAGWDILRGGAGDDIIFGGLNLDELIGGGGADRFVYTNIDQANLSTPDQINDFQSGVDTLDLSIIDANTFIAGDQAFRFIGTAAFSGTGAASAGELRVFTADAARYWELMGDVDGDGFADFHVYFGTYNIGQPPVAGDILL